mmetsp:Transcript_26528/g.66494  ORF Transcript_26528/g.66494 Transcript_26528/m.66494 type:complete len:393 (+) Transcript_26528:356-1534(+)
MLHMEESRANAAAWTPLEPAPHNDLVRRIGWVESGNFMSSRHLLTAMRHSFPRIPPSRWTLNPNISSGVGSTMSELFFKHNLGMYQTERSLLAHVGVNASKMNAGVPRGSDHFTIRFADGADAYRALLDDTPTVTASLASKWSRLPALHAAVDSLAPQVDRLNVYLNDYESIPQFLRVPWITVADSRREPAGDLGDRGKFFWADVTTTTFHFTCDDDIIYPRDYVSRLVAFHAARLAEAGGGATKRAAAGDGPPRALAVGAHGIVLRPQLARPGVANKGYYASREVMMAFEALDAARVVHIIGTGTLAYRPADFAGLSLAEFREPNMADVWFGIAAQKRRASLVVVPHPDKWLREVNGTFEDSLYNTLSRKQADKAVTRAVQSHGEWKLHEL